MFWIPGSLASRAPRNDRGEVFGNLLVQGALIWSFSIHLTSGIAGSTQPSPATT
jgi:hypothetical protein